VALEERESYLAQDGITAGLAKSKCFLIFFCKGSKTERISFLEGVTAAQSEEAPFGASKALMTYDLQSD